MPLNNSSKFVLAVITIIVAWYLIDDNRYKQIGNKISSVYNTLMSDDSISPQITNEQNQSVEGFNNYFRNLEHMEEGEEQGSGSVEQVVVQEQGSGPVEQVVVEEDSSFMPRDDTAQLFNAEDSYGLSNVDGETVQASTITKEYNSNDYLPQEVNDQWFNTDFSQAEQNIKDQEMIDTRKFSFGVNTVGQSLKNPTYDLRGTIPNPKFQVSAWNNSSYETDYNIRSWCE